VCITNGETRFASVSFEAKRLLQDLEDDDVDYEKLFYLSRWLHPYCNNYRAANTDKERAAIAVERIQFFIDTDGKS
jgi:hypothetical protein